MTNHQCSSVKNSRGFRLALLTTARQCPRWIWEPLQAAISDGQASLVFVASISGLPKVSNPWMVELYARWEHKRFLGGNSLLDDVEVTARDSGPILSFSTHDVYPLAEELSNHGVDVLLVTPDTDRAVLDAIRIPIWKFRFGVSEQQHNDPGFWEVVDRSISTLSLVETSPQGGTAQVLETIVGRTDPRSWARNQLGLVAKASDLLHRWIPPQINRLQYFEPEDRSRVVAEEDSSRKSSLAVLGLLTRFGRHAASSAFHIGQWQLAVARSQDLRCLSDPEILIPPLDRFWCDPFPLLRNGAMHVFVEECLYESGRGHIAMLSRSAAGKWSTSQTVLERPYHLSYPFVFEQQGQLFMIPETMAAGRVELYRCAQFPDKWELDTVLVDNFAGSDATLWFQDNRWWIFVDVRDELYIQYADSLRGPWSPHHRNPVKSDSRSSRPAGRIFRNGADVIRPAQDCSIQYGHEVVFNKITRLTVCDFEEVEIGRLRTPWNGNVCCHTFNQIRDITVVDRFVQRRKRG